MIGESIMWKYIAQEPNCIRKLLASNQFSQIAPLLKSFPKICFVAHGSSYNAAITVRHFFAENCSMDVRVFTPLDLKTNGETILKEDETLIIGISQTGTSRGVLEALRMAKQYGRTTLAITNSENSPSAQLCDETFYLLCGDEMSNAKTKGYTNTLTALLLLAAEIGKNNACLSDARVDQIRQEISDSLNFFSKLKERMIAKLKKRRFGEKIEALYVLGDGMNFGTAMEGQLKMMETQCIPTACNNTGEFSHGMHRSISAHIHTIVIDVADSGEHIDEIQSFLQECGNQNILITTNSKKQGNIVLEIPLFPLTQSVLLTTLLIQTISVFVPEINGNDPNRNSHDSLTDFVHTRIVSA